MSDNVTASNSHAVLIAQIADLSNDLAALRARLAEAERERDALRKCHESELGVCREHCPELSSAVKALEGAVGVMCRATFPGPVDKRDLNRAIDLARSALKESSHG